MGVHIWWNGMVEWNYSGMDYWNDGMLASFPGRSHLQYLIAYSMQILEVGTAWERG